MILCHTKNVIRRLVGQVCLTFRICSLLFCVYSFFLTRSIYFLLDPFLFFRIDHTLSIYLFGISILPFFRRLSSLCANQFRHARQRTLSQIMMMTMINKHIRIHTYITNESFIERWCFSGMGFFRRTPRGVDAVDSFLHPRFVRNVCMGSCPAIDNTIALLPIMIRGSSWTNIRLQQALDWNSFRQGATDDFCVRSDHPTIIDPKGVQRTHINQRTGYDLRRFPHDDDPTTTSMMYSLRSQCRSQFRCGGSTLSNGTTSLVSEGKQT